MFVSHVSVKNLVTCSQQTPDSIKLLLFDVCYSFYTFHLIKLNLCDTVLSLYKCGIFLIKGIKSVTY